MLWSGQDVLAKWVLSTDAIDPVLICFLRNLIATPILFLCTYMCDGFPSLEIRDWPITFVVGASGIFGNQLVSILGVNLIGPDESAIMQPFSPAVAAILGSALGIEAFGLGTFAGNLKLIGILSSFSGAALMCDIVNLFKGRLSSRFIAGNAYFLADAICLAIYVVAQKPLLKKYSPLQITFFSYIFGTLLFCLYVLCGPVFRAGFFSIHERGWILTLYSGLASSATASFLITFANSHLSGLLVSSSWSVQILFTCSLSYLTLGIMITTREIFGTLCILVGLLSVCYANHLDERAAASEYEVEKRPMLDVGNIDYYPTLETC
jgi:drug/metabolite transporter (DMT)-like permease